MTFDKEYPSIPYMEAAAKRRIPSFVHDFLANGLGDNVAVRKSRGTLWEAIELMPRDLSEADQPN